MAAKKALKKLTGKLKTKVTATRAKLKAKAGPRLKAVPARAKKLKPARKVAPVPKGLHTVTPNLVVNDGVGALDFYKRAFGAKELSRNLGPDGKLWHAELRIGDSVLYVNDAMTGGRGPSTPAHPSPTAMMIYVKDCDALFERAVAAGGKTTMAVTDMFWGDRMGELMDPFGNFWSIATRKKNLTNREMAKATEEFARQMAAMGSPPPAVEASPAPVAQKSPPGGAQA